MQQPEEKNVSLSHVLSDLEIIEIVETELHNNTRDVMLNMNEIHEMHVNLLKQANSLFLIIPDKRYTLNNYSKGASLTMNHLHY